MSPRRRIDATAVDLLPEPTPKLPRHWGFILIASLSALLVAGAIAASTLVLISHESQRREQIRDSAVLGYVRSFMTEYTSLDPFHANDYADKILAQGTGDFAKTFKERQNEILISVARAEPTTGTVLDAGVERWNGEDSASVLVATKITSKSPDGKTVTASGNRWVATAIKEGQQWKISQLM
ncbi:MAG: mammalian cell entry protein [Mycobacteriaceae bacterium]|nr:mammalian cell entry protein [Mycobacteriaceae bacterium]